MKLFDYPTTGGTTTTTDNTDFIDALRLSPVRAAFIRQMEAWGNRDIGNHKDFWPAKLRSDMNTALAWIMHRGEVRAA
jgi:hypothetical protein